MSHKPAVDQTDSVPGVTPELVDPAPAPSADWYGKTAQGVDWRVIHGDARKALGKLADEQFHCVVTSPPYYWQRDYQAEGQIGLEWKVEEYVTAIADAMDETKRVLRKDGLLFLNLGDTYYSRKGQPKGNDRKNPGRRFGVRAVDVKGLGLPKKSTIGIPWRVALRMIDRDWVLRSPIVWKRNQPVPEPKAHDRPWRSYEMVFMFSRATRYHFDRDALGGDQDVWTFASQSKVGNHPAVFPAQLVKRCLDVGCPTGGSVLDPFVGSGTTMRVALASGRPATGVDVSLPFCERLAAKLGTL